MIDLSGLNLNCPSPRFYPFPVEFAVGTFFDGYALVCGGFGELNSTERNVCYKYDSEADLWNPAPSLITARDQAAGTMLSSTEWWVTGGEADYDTLNNTEIFDGTSFMPGKNLPDFRHGHVLVSVNDSHVMLFGDDDETTNKAWIFDKTLEEWTPIADMIYPRENVQGGRVRFENGSVAVVAAGGQGVPFTEIYFLEEEEWNLAGNSPLISTAANVQFGDTVLMVGGYRQGTFEHSIYMYDTTSNDQDPWILLEERLTLGSSGLTAFMVPETYVTCSTRN